jgi:hypothetical protein
MGRRLSGENESVAYERPRRVAFRTTSGPGLLASYEVVPAASGARLTAKLELDVAGRMSVAEPLIAASLRRDVTANLKRLKQILEAPVAVAADAAAASRS